MNGELIKSILVTAELTQTQLSETAVLAMESELLAYPLEAVMNALTRCRRELTGRLTLAAVLERIETSDGRISANEAWAMMPRSEQDSVVLSDEMSQAMGIAQPLLDQGDQVGARMAFIGAYDRLVSDARRAGIKPRWIASLGWDQDKRRECIEQAVRVGRINSSYAAGLLPAPRETGPVMAAIMGQPTLRIASFDGNVVEMMSDEETAKKAIEHLRGMLKKGAQ